MRLKKNLTKDGSTMAKSLLLLAVQSTFEFLFLLAWYTQGGTETEAYSKEFDITFNLKYF